jgi:Ca-activated chloride channel family protein
MIPFNQRLMYSGVAAAAVAALAVGIVVQNPPRIDLPEIPIPTESEEAISGRQDQAAGRRSEDFADADSAAPATPQVTVAGPKNQPLEAEVDEAYAVPVAKEKRSGAEVLMDFAASAPQAESLQVQPSVAGGAVAKREAIPGAARFITIPGEPVPAPGYQDVGRDTFEEFEQNTVKLVSDEPVSTFSADVDTASYSFVRRMLNQGVLPQSDAVRAEELINYFDYSYALPDDRGTPFASTVAVSDAPWAEGRKLMHIGIKGFDIPVESTPRSNLVFLLDVSGSMNSPDKLPLVKQSMELLLSTLDPDDTVAIAVYAGAAGAVLEPTPVREKQKILDAMRSLSAGGSTAGAQGIRLAYELAESQFDKGAVNRVILATDGDFNVGITNQRELQSFIERKRERGIFLSVLGFGQGNYQDAMMQTLAQNGNGVAAYIDTLSEVQKVLVDEATSTLFPIAKDVKLQLEFNPATVAEYRLVGYETRHLNREDFNNDAVDAGDIGAGHTVTAIYEFTPVGSDARQIEESRYAPKPQVQGKGDEYAFLKIRYKLPEEDSSELITRPVTRGDAVELGGGTVGREAGFATSVAAFAQLLKGGKYTGDYSYDDVIALAQQTKGDDPYGYRTEFIQLVRKAKTAAAMQAR